MASQGFNNSFDKSFQTGMVTGSNAALEAIKEKIKKEADSAEKKSKLANVKVAAITDLEGLSQMKDVPQQIKDYAASQVKVINALTDADTATEAYKSTKDFLSKTLAEKTKPNKQVFQVGQSGLKQVGEVPGNAEVFKETLTPEEYSDRVQQATKLKEQEQLQAKLNETAVGVSSGIRSWATGLIQFERAFPSDGKTPLKQRIGGLVEGNLAKAGLVDNAQLVGAQKAVVSSARAAVRAWGDKGALSTPDVQNAIQVLDQSGLTFKEKMAAYKASAERAMSALDDATIENLFKREPYTKDLLDSFDIKYGESLRQDITQAISRSSFKSGDTREKNGVTYQRSEDGTWRPLKNKS